MAKEYENLVVDELQEKSCDNLHLRKESSQSQSALAFMTSNVEMMRGEEQATKDEARSAVLAVESGVQSLQDRLGKEEIARSEVARRMEQAEDHIRQPRERERPLSALHDELGELRQRLKQQEELQLRAQQMWKQELDAARR